MDLARYAATHGLRRVGARPPFRAYLAQTWRRRDFIWTMARFRLRAGLEDNRLGVLWLLLNPCLNALIYGAIFGVLQSSSSRGPDYIPRVIIGVFLWQFFASSLADGSKSITRNRALVQSLAFPRLTLPVSRVAEQFLSMVPSLILLIVILPIFGHWPRPQWLLLFPLLVLYTLFNLGITLIAARLTVHLRDLTQVLPFITRLLFYTSGVLFNVETLFDAHPWVITVFDFHPLYQMLQLARGALMGITVDPMYWLYFSIWSVVIFIVGLLFFWAAEERYGRD